MSRPLTGAERQRLRNPANLWRALIPLLILVGGIVLFAWPRGDTSDGVHVVDIAAPIAAARSDGLPVLTPTGLNVRWRPTSVDYTEAQVSNGRTITPASLRIGFVSPSGNYAELFESAEAPEAALATYGPLTSQNSVLVGSVSWDGFQTDRNRELIRHLTAKISVIVTGSASTAELSTLAGSLR